MGVREDDREDSVSEAQHADETVMTAKDAAAFLSVNVRTLYKLVDENKIPHVRMTERRIRFLKSSLLAWLARRESAPGRRPR